MILPILEKTCTKTLLNIHLIMILNLRGLFCLFCCHYQYHCFYFHPKTFACSNIFQV
jgi:hypothetical protein